jgi:hypothetical protein
MGRRGEGEERLEWTLVVNGWPWENERRRPCWAGCRSSGGLADGYCACMRAVEETRRAAEVLHGKGMGKYESRRWVATDRDRHAHWQPDSRFLKRPALPPKRFPETGLCF